MDLRLYAFHCGDIDTDKGIVEAGIPSRKERIITPVECFVILHPEGKLLFDTGMHPKVMSNAVEYWGPVAKHILIPKYSPRQDIMSQIKIIGLNPKDISHVALSHLHLDHSGCINYFASSEVLVQHEEYLHAIQPVPSQSSGYIRSEFEGNINFNFIHGVCDVFGDRRVVLFPTPGHTTGHQSLYVELDSIKIILTGDSCYLERNLEEISPPGPCADVNAAKCSLRFLRKWRDITDGLVLAAHDEEQWKRVKKAPQYYS